VRIFREPDLSGDFLVDERGIVVLPKLGEWNAAGVSADSVRPQLVAAYHKYLTTDAIEITPYRRVAVTGAVLKPGLYPIDASMTVGDAIMLAGGVSPSGKRDVVELRQANEPSGVRITSERRLWESGAGGIRQLYVPQEGWMKRNVLTVVSVSLSVLTATTLLIRR
jgi:polysaccharide export outer membrane protein